MPVAEPTSKRPLGASGLQLPAQALAVPMQRVAVLARHVQSRDLLVALADIGAVHLAGPLAAGAGEALQALRRLERRLKPAGNPEPSLSASEPDVDSLERAGAWGALAGEVELQRRMASALRHGRYVAFVGWAPEPELETLSGRLGALGAALVELPSPSGLEPPTLPAPSPAIEPLRPLVNTYGIPAYPDVDPTPWAAASFFLMFGIMFGDVGDGLLLLVAALGLSRMRGARWRSLRRASPFLLGAGLSASVFGLLFGEFFGPTGVVPTLWLKPLDSPTKLLVPMIVLGGLLMAGSSLIGIVNRRREDGLGAALTAASGVAGLALLAAFGLLAAGVAAHSSPLTVGGSFLAVIAALLLGAGYRAEAGRGPGALGEIAIRVLDTALRTFANAVSFTRLAAFGLMHAALGMVVLDAARGVSGGTVGAVAAAAVFVLGSAVAFALEGLVATVQALRLEYYELFSRVFANEGRPFRPWRLPVLIEEEAG